MEPAGPPLIEKMPEQVAATARKPPRSWVGSTIVILAAVAFLVAVIEPQSPAQRQLVESVFHNWIAMAVCAAALGFARLNALGPLPSILRRLSGVLLPVFIILTALELLTWPPLWNLLRPLGVVEAEVRPAAIDATFAIAFIGLGFLMLRAAFRWLRKLRGRYEHAGFAVGFGPLYVFFRRRRASQ